jgi:hypothetical protein
VPAATCGSTARGGVCPPRACVCTTRARHHPLRAPARQQRRSGSTSSGRVRRFARRASKLACARAQNALREPLHVEAQRICMPRHRRVGDRVEGRRLHQGAPARGLERGAPPGARMRVCAANEVHRALHPRTAAAAAAAAPAPAAPPRRRPGAAWAARRGGAAGGGGSRSGTADVDALQRSPLAHLPAQQAAARGPACAAAGSAATCSALSGRPSRATPVQHTAKPPRPRQAANGAGSARSAHPAQAAQLPAQQAAAASTARAPWWSPWPATPR